MVKMLTSMAVEEPLARRAVLATGFVFCHLTFEILHFLCLRAYTVATVTKVSGMAVQTWVGPGA